MATPKDSGFHFDRVWLRDLKFEDVGEYVPKGTAELELEVAVNLETPKDNREAIVAVTLDHSAEVRTTSQPGAVWLPN